MKLPAIVLFCFISLISAGQINTATVSGIVIDDDEKPVAHVSVSISGTRSGEITGADGSFRITVPSQKAFALVFSATGYQEKQKNFLLSSGEQEFVTIKLSSDEKTLQTVVISDESERRETGLIRVNPKNVLMQPSAAGGIESLIKTLVGSNNELTSQYAVRGGNYDENLVYINDFEIYRPYLVRSGQQEGLSLINPELVKSIHFYNGGFQAKYGDKISSVLDIQYKKPVQFHGSAYLSLLEQGFSMEGTSTNKKFTWLTGARTKTSRNLVSRQETKGNYQPSSADLQAFLTYQLSARSHIELLAITSGTKFFFIPESAQKSTAAITPLFARNIGLDIFFEGQEKDSYQSSLLGASLINKMNDKVNLKWMASRFTDLEREHFDIAGAYLFGDRNFDRSSSDFGKIVNPLGSGLFQNFARNNLNIQAYNFGHKGSYKSGSHFFIWGANLDHTIIHDKLNEWEYIDSAGYSLPFNPDRLELHNVLKSAASLKVDKWSGYIQDNIRLGGANQDITFQGGVRFNYNSLNKELIVSPRAQFSFKPSWQSDIIFKTSVGWYAQPPFYRELRRMDGTLNTSLKSQKSLQVTGGFDYNFARKERPARITTEIYYKALTDVVPYDIENLRIRYYGENSAVAYAMGIETRIFTELVKDAESWFSIALSRTEENIKGNFYYTYYNKEGQEISAKTVDQVIADSVKTMAGYIRRPSDRLLTMGLFLQDYLSTNKNFKVHLNVIYGSNMTYNIPGNVKFRNALIIEPYMRVDLGLSALLLGPITARRSHSPFAGIDNIWASLEIFNLIDRANTISYQLVKDFSNNTFSLPNRLTPRMVNVKVLVRW